jgi:hypothetical protein
MLYTSLSAIKLVPEKLEISLDAVCPFNLVIDPSMCLSFVNNSLSLKPYKITYDFGDGSPILTKSLTPRPNLTDESLTWSKEPGDPRNFRVSHFYNLKNSNKQTFEINIKAHCFSDPSSYIDGVSYKILLKLSPPSTLPNDYFEDIHLHSVRMFGADNTVMYNFETQNPSYLLPTVVKWIFNPLESPSYPNLKSNNRPYTLKSAFEK